MIRSYDLYSVSFYYRAINANKGLYWAEGNIQNLLSTSEVHFREGKNNGLRKVSQKDSEALS